MTAAGAPVPVIVETPFAAPTAGERAKNKRYLHHAMRDSLLMFREAPFASHRLYTGRGILDDDVDVERALGIEAGLVWGAYAYRTVVYTDLGISGGMRYGIARAHEQGRPVVFRTLSAWHNGNEPQHGFDDEAHPQIAALLAETNTLSIELALAREKHRRLQEVWPAIEPLERERLLGEIFT